jgi:tetratricopeptide (TPR) repeat protein
VTLLNQGKHQESLEYFDKALEIEPNRLGAIINKANALQDLNRLDEAAVFFHKAWSIDKDPLSWTPRFVIIKE